MLVLTGPGRLWTGRGHVGMTGTLEVRNTDVAQEKNIKRNHNSAIAFGSSKIGTCKD